MNANRFRNDRGSALIEFAACSLFYFIFAFSIIEASRAIYLYNTLANVAREGTRFAAVRGAGSGRVTTESAVRTYVQSRSAGLNPTVSVTWSPATKLPGGAIQVVVTGTFSPIVPIAWISNIAMSATANAIVLD